MTGLLASVTTAAEAVLACAAGADIIDLKDPSAGALGALSAPVIRAIVERVGGQRPVSATVGDLPMQPDLVGSAAARVGGLGVDFVKVGIFPGGDLDGCLAALGVPARAGRRIVAVLFADQAPDFALVERARAIGLAGVMLDTADKGGGGLRHHLDLDRLAEFVGRARGAGLLTGLAGSLGLGDIAPLAALRPDYLGFRGALCGTGRTSALDPARLAGVCAALRAAADAQPAVAAARAATATAGAQRAAHSQVSGAPETRVAKST